MRGLVLAVVASLLGPVMACADAPPKDYRAVDLPTLPMLKRPAGLPPGTEVATAPPRRVRWVRMTDLPDKGRQTLWSTWGDGCIASNGRYYTSIGDHMGVDATSLLYEFNPLDGKLRLVADIFRSLKLPAGAYGHGKVHSGIHQAEDGWLYFSTYWGKHREIEEAFKSKYRGSVVMRLHPESHELQNLGAIVPRQGLPASLFDPERGLLYFYAVYENNLTAYDVKRQQRVFLGGADVIEGSRAMLIDGQGRVYTSGKGGRMMRFDPAAGQLEETPYDLSKLPASDSKKAKSQVLRAGLPAPLPDGRLIGMTGGGRMFAIDLEQEQLTDLGDNIGGGSYTAAMKASPDGRYIYYAPGAHGSGARLGGPIVRFDLETRKPTVIAFLADVLQQKGYQLGGSYNLQLTSDGKTLMTTFNGAAIDPNARKKMLFGQPCVITIDLE